MYNKYSFNANSQILDFCFRDPDDKDCFIVLENNQKIVKAIDKETVQNIINELDKVTKEKDRILAICEKNGIDVVEKEVNKDEIISELSSRLEVTLAELESTKELLTNVRKDNDSNKECSTNVRREGEDGAERVRDAVENDRKQVRVRKKANAIRFN